MQPQRQVHNLLVLLKLLKHNHLQFSEQKSIQIHSSSGNHPHSSFEGRQVRPPRSHSLKENSFSIFLSLNVLSGEK